MSTAPTFSEVLRRTMAAHTSDMRTALPGRVVRYDRATCKADVQPLIMDPVTDDTGARQAAPLPIVVDVPVLMPAAGGIRIRLPIQIGDYVLLVFASSSLDLWLQRGGLVDPADDRRHDLSDALALPGLFDFAHVTDAPAQIEFTDDGRILVGGSDPLALRSDLDFLAQQIRDCTPSPTTEPGLLAIKAAVVLNAAWPFGTNVVKGS